MMKIRATLTPNEAALLSTRDISNEICVVIDVLRATSTIVTALQHGVREIIPAGDLEEAQVLKKQHPAALLGGERQGEKISGFDLGNSPLEYLDLAGQTIISTTTNGTVVLRACEGAREILACSLLNVAATADYLRKSEAEIVRVVCAGTGRSFSLEDAVCGGALIEALPSAVLTDAARGLSRLWRSGKEDPLGALKDSANGRRLMSIGREEEIRWCAQVDAFPLVARLVEGSLRRAN